MKPLIIEKEEIVKLLDFKEIISAVEKSFVTFSLGKTVMPPPQDIVLEKFRGETHVKSAYADGSEFYCVKIASGFYDNPNIGQSSSQGMMILFEAKTGIPKCILLDDGMLTDYRTAAAGAVAAKQLANVNSSKVLVLGTGIQARLQIEFLIKVFPIDKVFVWSRSKENTNDYCNYFIDNFSIEVNSVDCIKSIKEVDIIVTATPSRVPWIYEVDKGVHINAIGSDMPGKQELDGKLLGEVKVVTDSTLQCAKNGELQHALKSGDITLNDVHAELGEILAKAKKGREFSDEITVFDSTGLGVQDLAIANYVFKKFNCQN
jgi:ornithine cyclodeaminase